MNMTRVPLHAAAMVVIWAVAAVSAQIVVDGRYRGVVRNWSVCDRACEAPLVWVAGFCPEEALYLKCDVYSWTIVASDPGQWQTVGSELVLSCNNCNGCDPMTCVREVSRTTSTTVSATGTGLFSTSIRGEIQAALAGSVGAEVTTQFEQGRTSTSTVVESDSVQCGSQSIGNCHHTDYYMDHKRRVPSALAQVEWLWFYRCESWTPGVWSAITLPPFSPCAETFVLLDGTVADEVGCRAESVQCPPPQPDCCDK